MGVTLSIEISSPLEPEDRELLTGISIMTLAIANHELAKEHFPGTFPDPGQEDEGRPCGSPSDADPPTYCVREIGHAGRHRYRPLDLHTGEWRN